MNLRCNCRAAISLIFFAAALAGQAWEVPSTNGLLKLGIEQRERYEIRSGTAFGNAPEIETGLARTRVSLTFQNSWLKASGMLQDSRAPWYGPNAPGTVRDPIDLHEAYVEAFPDRKTGWSAAIGRRMLNYGEGRLIGTPQWGNVARTYDYTRLTWSSKRARIEGLFVSPIVFRPEEFNRPVLGNRVWGAYSSFPAVWKKALLEAYVLRHDQNRPGGFTGVGNLGVNTAGFRLAGPFLKSWRYSVEGAAQNGHVGPARHRAGAWYSLAGWHREKLDVTAEYKVASGTGNPRDTTRVSTFDQLYPANHDKFGHEDLLGWRNLHNVRALATYEARKGWSWNAMYNQFWLASACDALYNGAGAPIARSATCSAGSHVGQEADVFTVYRYKHVQVGAGYGYFWTGEFLRQTTKGGPTYVYVFHTLTM